MKFPSLLTFSLSALLAGGLLFAQGFGPMGGHGGMGRPGGMGGPGGLKFLTNYLSLTATQQTQAQAIFTAEHQSAQPVMTQLKTQRQAIEAAIEAGQTPEQVTQLATAEGPLLAQEAGIRAAAQAQFWALLTPDQQTKLKSLHASMQPSSPPVGAPPVQ